MAANRIMEESDFWTHLEFRLCDEMAGNDLCSRHGLWCDGLTPSQYWLGEDPPRIEGMTWIGSGPRNQEEWRFTLLLPRTYGNVDQIDWAALLPPQEVTDWLAVDIERKRLEMSPSVAMLDAEHERSSLRRLEHAVQRLALGPTEQIAHFPDFVAVADELALDFANWRQVCESSGYVRVGLLAEHLQLLDAHLDAMSGEDKAELWTSKALHDAPEWGKIRSLAQEALRTANWSRVVPPKPDQDGDTFVQAGD